MKTEFANAAKHTCIAEAIYHVSVAEWAGLFSATAHLEGF